MVNFLNILLIVSEKAANIARVCRQNENLFNILVQEKENDEANTRFFKDFKTLADVLIQETVRHDIKQHFPVLEKRIYGEENNTFTNTLGETIEVKVCSLQEETTQLLEIVLNGNSTAANILASEVHKTVLISDIIIDRSTIPLNFEVDIDNICVWIDPIDSTAEYINAKESKDKSGIHLTGLQCVTVLLGAYDKRTGIPLIGVINQPFYEQIDTEWRGRCYWGCSSSENRFSSLQISNDKTNLITLSRVELTTIKTKLTEFGYKVVEAAGAGYKLLTVINGLADAYVVSQGTTFQWDVCGPHAVLRAMGGGVYSYSKMIEGNCIEINYKSCYQSDEPKTNKYCNKEGLIAVKNKEIFDVIMGLLKN